MLLKTHQILRDFLVGFSNIYFYSDKFIRNVLDLIQTELADGEMPPVCYTKSGEDDKHDRYYFGWFRRLYAGTGVADAGTK